MKKRAAILVPVLALIVILWFALAPPRFWLNLTRRVDLSDPVAAGQALVTQYDCQACHQVHGQGRPFGPSLDGVTRRLEADELRLWLRQPQKVKPNTTMPNLRLSDSEIEAIIAYLAANDQ
ncbi:MAG: c-type cytochrome [Chloroflexota bacterium]